MALEAVAMVYSNVLRDHVNRVSFNKYTQGYPSVGLEIGAGWRESNTFENSKLNILIGRFANIISEQRERYLFQ